MHDQDVGGLGLADTAEEEESSKADSAVQDRRRALTRDTQGHVPETSEGLEKYNRDELQ